MQVLYVNDISVELLKQNPPPHKKRNIKKK